MSISKGFLVDIDVTEPAPADSAIMRRRLLGVGLGGAVAALVPLLSGRASATTTTGSTTDTTPGSTADTAAATTTTTTPPKRPTDADITELAFAQTLEVAIRDLYDVALRTDVFDRISEP